MLLKINLYTSNFNNVHFMIGQDKNTIAMHVKLLIVCLKQLLGSKEFGLICHLGDKTVKE